MSDRAFGERLGYSQQAIAAAKSGKMTDPLAIKIAEVLNLEPGEIIWTARTERERDPVVRAYLERWTRRVGKAIASVSATVVKSFVLTMALGSGFLPAHDAQAFVGGAGGFRRRGAP